MLVQETRATVRRPAPAVLGLGAASLVLLAASLAFASTPATRKKPIAAPQLSAAAQAFLRQQCLSCHSKTSASGGLNLSVPFQPTNADSFKQWVKVVDRV